MKKFIFILLFLPSFAFAQVQVDVWIQYDLATGQETGTNSKKVPDAELAALGKGQIEYIGTGEPTLMRVDITQTPPVVVPQ